MSKGPSPSGRHGPVVLIVLDGWGYRPKRDGNAIELGQTPVWHGLWDQSPRTLLEASGRDVGLPAGQMGNSEVGHLNLGAGRVVRQDLVRISESIASGDFYQIPALAALCRGVAERNKTLHLLALIGNGGVHALDRHLDAALELGRRFGVPRIAVHGFMDGRDTLPTSGAGFLHDLVRATAAHSGGKTEAAVATLVGRYYAMDRDRRWDRIQLAYDAMVRGAGRAADDPVAAVESAYQRGETDEFVKPIVLQRDGRPVATIADGDGILCVNFRADRMRQIVRALALDGFDGFAVQPRPKVELVMMTQYDATFPFPAAFAPQSMANLVANVVSDAGMTMFRTAETEKYAHVTYFFNGGVEVPCKGEERLLVDSQKVATYDLKPEMSAPGVTDVLCKAIEGKQHDFILCNYANGDMVGHTGVIAAAVTAVSVVDQCLARVLASAARARAAVLITADHGNCEMMIDPVTGGPHTAHTTNPVPLVFVGDGVRSLRQGGSLRDVGPTVLTLLGLPIPAEMTGRDLREGA